MYLQRTIKIYVVYEDDRGMGVTMSKAFTSLEDAQREKGSSEYIEEIDLILSTSEEHFWELLA